MSAVASPGRYRHTVRRKDRQPFVPPYCVTQMMLYPDEMTCCQLLDTVSAALYQHNFTTVREVAEFLNLEPIKLTHAIEVLTGTTMSDVVRLFVMRRVRQALADHPDQTLDEVARSIGYHSKSSITYICRNFSMESARGKVKY